MQYIMNTDKDITGSANVFFAEYVVLRNFLCYPIIRFFSIRFNRHHKISDDTERNQLLIVSATVS